jgi:hypothetical protein
LPADWTPCLTGLANVAGAAHHRLIIVTHVTPYDAMRMR